MVSFLAQTKSGAQVLFGQNVTCLVQKVGEGMCQEDPAIKQCMMLCIFYAMETYIMHFLEPARFLNAPDLAGQKVNVLYDPGLPERPPPLQLFTYLWVFGP